MLLDILWSSGGQFWALLVISVVLTYYYVWFSGRRGCHHGPIPLPIFGNVLSLLTEDFPSVLADYGRKYGDAYTLWVCHQPVVMLSGSDVIKEAFVKNADSLDRRPPAGLLDSVLQSPGVFSSDNTDWRQYKRFLLKTFRDFGMGKNIMEMAIHQEIEALSVVIDSTEGRPFDLAARLRSAVSNITCAVALGKRFDYDDAQFIRLQEHVLAVLGNRFTTILPAYAMKIPGDPFRARDIERNIKAIDETVSKLVDEHLESYNEADLSDMIYRYIHNVDMHKLEGTELQQSKRILVRLLFETLIGGIDTTSTLLGWSTLHLARNQDAQDGLFNELLDTVKSHRLPSVADKGNLKLLGSFICEVQRHTPMAPFALPHVCSQDVNIYGGVIKKGTIVFGRLFSRWNDPKLWNEPDRFDAARFLDEKASQNFKEIMTFSVGSRSCPGESLATMEIFLILAALLQRYKILPAEEGVVPPLSASYGNVTVPKPFMVRAVRREF